MRPGGRSRAALIALALGCVAGGCAAFGSNIEETAEERLEQGLAAADGGDYAAAYEHLSWAAREAHATETGSEALLALTALELDPRNPRRRLWATSELARRYLGIADQEPWTIRVAETLYLVALELGAVEEAQTRAERRAEEAEEEAREAREEAAQAQQQLARERRLPRFEGQTVPQRVAAARGDTERLQARIAELERTVAAQREELTRIRQTLSP